MNNYAAQSDPGHNPNFKRRWTDPPHCESLRSGGSPAAVVVAGLEFRDQVRRVHALGARVLGELLAEIGTERSIMPTIHEKLERYASIDPQALRVAGGDKFPQVPLHEVRREA